MSVFSQIGAQEANVTDMTRVPGLDIAEVTNIKDPDKLNRVKCKVITKNPDVGESNWAMVSTFMSGNQMGATFLPNVGDIVLLGYIGGDVHMPVVLGGIWTSESKMPYPYDADGKNPIRSIKTPGGSEVLIDETQDKVKISVTTPAGTNVTLDDGGEKISIQDKTAKNALTFDLKAGKAELKAEKGITLQTGSCKLIMDGQGGKMNLESQNQFAFKSAQVNAEASGTMNVKSSGQLTLQSSAMAQLKGAMVKIN